jgi:hypothetical protein
VFPFCSNIFDVIKSEQRKEGIVCLNIDFLRKQRRRGSRKDAKNILRKEGRVELLCLLYILTRFQNAFKMLSLPSLRYLNSASLREPLRLCSL